jgi:hypothetical protein
MFIWGNRCGTHLAECVPDVSLIHLTAHALQQDFTLLNNVDTVRCVTAHCITAPHIIYIAQVPYPYSKTTPSRKCINMNRRCITIIQSVHIFKIYRYRLNTSVGVGAGTASRCCSYCFTKKMRLRLRNTSWQQS